MPLVAGTRLGPYEIVAPLGAGGMGEVYRARDIRLERDVALKVLPEATVADETARARLLREARIAARLNHPNVCTIHEVGEADGQAYVAMELVHGQTLGQRLARGRLGADEVLLLGHQLADALAHAHDSGVVHRDFKSANVIVTPTGRAKVLDFGLAKPFVEMGTEVQTLTKDSLTAAGAVVGTLAYMSPEQLKGGRADARSDVWALGVVLHEMATGARPFAGKTGYELSSAILNDPPAPLPAGLPTPLAAVVERCLAKDPAQRYARAGEVRSALETMQGGGTTAAWRPSPATRRRWMMLTAVVAAAALSVLAIARWWHSSASRAPIRIAVLPFRNLTGDVAQDFFSDGMTEEIIARLGRIRMSQLRVAAPSSSMRFKGRDVPTQEVGRELGVDYVVEGSANREGDRVRVTATLIQVSDGFARWSETFDRKVSSVLGVQGDIAQGVIGSLSVNLLPGERARLGQSRSVVPEAYEAYLKGRSHHDKLTRADLDAAEKYFNLALSLDPTYAPAYAGMAGVWAGRRQMGFVPPQEASPRLQEAVDRALAIDDTLSEAHLYRAVQQSFGEWKWAERKEAEFLRAIELAPSFARAHSTYGHYLLIQGRPDEALAETERAVALDPLSELARGFYATVLHNTGRSTEAIRQAEQVLATTPESPYIRNLMVDVYSKIGTEAQAFDAEVARWSSRHDDAVVTALRQGYEEGGLARARRRAADTLAKRAESGTFVAPVPVAVLYLRSGDLDTAFAWLERAFEGRDPNLPYIAASRAYEGVRGDPRYLSLLRRLGLKPPPG